jgi:hypothetical protein
MFGFKLQSAGYNVLYKEYFDLFVSYICVMHLTHKCWHSIQANVCGYATLGAKPLQTTQQEAKWMDHTGSQKKKKKSVITENSKFGLGPLACSDSEFDFETYESIFGHLVGLLGREISPSQGYYLHRTAQCKEKLTHIHASSGIRSHDPRVRAVEDRTCLRPSAHWDWHREHFVQYNFMGQSSSWEGESSSPGKEILRLYWNPKVRYRVHMSCSCTISQATCIQLIHFVIFL